MDHKTHKSWICMIAIAYATEVPGRPFQSKLEPFRLEIFTLRRDRQTYAQIAAYLLEKHQVVTTTGAVASFIRVRINNPAGPLGFHVPNFDEAAGVVKVVPGPRKSRTADAAPPAAVETSPLTPGPASSPPTEDVYIPKSKPENSMDLRFNHEVDDG